MLEKKFRAIPPQLTTTNGDSSGKIGTADACTFKVEQKVILKATGEPNLLARILDIPNNTTLILGPEGARKRSDFIDLSAYTIAKITTIEAPLQDRPPVTEQDSERWTYEESPVVARRAFLVDKCGNSYDDNNPFPVEATITESRVQNRFIYRIVYPTAGNEQSQILPNNTKKLHIAAIGNSTQKSAKMRISFIQNGTLDINNNYTTVKKGNAYFREGLKLQNKTLYFQTDKNNIVVEIEAWV